MSYASEIDRITRRLQESEGRRIARRNALRALDTLLRRIRRELRRTYPTIRKDGRENTIIVMPKGNRRCPTDGVYVPTPGAFARHVIRAHNGQCWCGYSPEDKEISRLASHFRYFRNNIDSHVMMGVIKQMGGRS